MGNTSYYKTKTFSSFRIIPYIVFRKCKYINYSIVKIITYFFWT